MGDFHFVVRHGLTGGVLLIFLLLGIFVADRPMLDRGIAFLTEHHQLTGPLATVLIAVVFTTPVVGIVVQGLYTLWLHAWGRAFTDEARRLIADSVRAAAGRSATVERKEIQDIWKRLFHRMPDDSAFVWLYYMDAPAHLVDWARRRRSYHYLGVNWAIAAWVGSIIGLCAPSLTFDADEDQILIFLFLLAFWSLGAIFLAILMKRDADYMEFVWAFSRVHPDEFKELLQDLRRM